MLNSRLTQHLGEIGLEASRTPVTAATAFVMAPASLTSSGQAQLLQWAYEKAQKVAMPSWIDRDVLGSWN